MTPTATVQAWVVAAIVLIHSGCKSDGSQIKPPAAHEFPSYQQLADHQNQRVSLLRTMYARGVLELRWTDPKGKEHHEPQIDMDLWISLPRHTALRATKIGEDLLWIGSDMQRWWFFDMLGEEKVLYLGRHEDRTDTIQAIGVKPLALLDLLGLAELPLASPSSVEFDPQRDAWVVPTEGRGGRIRMFFDRRSLLPIRVESLDATGQVALFSALHLSRYESVPQPGMAPPGFPKMAELIDIVSLPRGDQTLGGEVKFALNHATGEVNPEELQRVFDLQKLVAGLAPDRVESPNQ